MKKAIRNSFRNSLGAVLITGALLTSIPTQAQTSVVMEPVTSMGTISEFSPETIMIRSEAGSAPIRYGYSKTTTYVDEAGSPVSMTMIKSGLPVTVYYTKTGNALVATKVVVRKAAVSNDAVIEEKNTTTTTTETK